MRWPQAFIERMSRQLNKTDFEAFEQAHNNPAPVSIRLNKLKPAPVPLDSQTIGWHKAGYYLPTRPNFTTDPYHHAGGYYVQEASSMLVGSIASLFDPDKPITVLDLCAAPGGKTTLMADLLPSGSIIVANEPVPNRASALKENLIRWGHIHSIVTMAEPHHFKALAGFFDLVLVDAPCSGEGLWRKDPDAIVYWSLQRLEQCVKLQTLIIQSAVQLVKPSGYLVYSTCTYNPAENIGIAKTISESLSPISLGLENQSYGVDILALPNNKAAYQCYPHRFRGEGFFLATFINDCTHEVPNYLSINKTFVSQKQDHAQTAIKQYLPEFLLKEFVIFNEEKRWFATNQKLLQITHILKRLGIKVIKSGLYLGEQKGHDFIPAFDLSMLPCNNRDLPIYSLNFEGALRYLRGDSNLPTAEFSGYGLARYQNATLGWIKSINHGKRVNNLYPSTARIVHY